MRGLAAFFIDLCVCFAAFASLSPATAIATAVEQLAQLAVCPGDPQKMVLRYRDGGDGLFYSTDGGQTFTLMCGSSVWDPRSDAGPLTELGPIALTGGGTVLLGAFKGLWVDDGKGCAWSHAAELSGRWVSDIVPHPSDPGVAFMITANGLAALNGITRRNADGTLTELGSKVPLQLGRLRVTERPDGRLRFYESIVLGHPEITDDAGITTAPPSYGIRVSDDEGETWRLHELGTFDGWLWLEAIDPSNPDRIVLSVERDRDLATNMPLADDILVSDDQGESFRLWTQVTKLGGIAFSPEGEIWIGDSGDTRTPEAMRGIQHAASLAEQPTVLIGDFPVNCLHYAGDALLVCKRFALGRLSLTERAFTPSVELSKVEAMNSCDGVDMAALCRPQLCEYFCGATHFATAPVCVDAYASTRDAGCAPLVPPALPGASLDAGLDAGFDSGMTTDARDSDDGCSCAAVGARRDARAGYAAALGLLALALRSTRRRPAV